MFRKVAVLSVVMLSFCLLGLAQGAPPAEPPATPPAKLQLTAREFLTQVEELLEQFGVAQEEGRGEEMAPLLLDAARGLQAVLSREPQNMAARALAGDVSMELGDRTLARDFFKQVLEVDRNNFRANLGLGRFYVMARIFRQATAYLETAERVAPPARRTEVLRLLALSYSGQGQRDKAVDAAQRALQVDPADLESLQLLVRIWLEVRQVERAMETSEELLTVARQRRQQDPSDAQALSRLIEATEARMNTLQFYFRSLCRRDARGRVSDQLQPGTAAQAVDALSQTAYLAEEIAKLRWEKSYHETLTLIKQAAEKQAETTRAAMINNTGYLLILAELLEATHQPERAIAIYQRIGELTDPTDVVSAEAERNKQTAKERLLRLGGPPASQPAAEPAPGQ